MFFAQKSGSALNASETVHLPQMRIFCSITLTVHFSNRRNFRRGGRAAVRSALSQPLGRACSLRPVPKFSPRRVAPRKAGDGPSGVHGSPIARRARRPNPEERPKFLELVGCGAIFGIFLRRTPQRNFGHKNRISQESGGRFRQSWHRRKADWIEGGG